MVALDVTFEPNTAQEPGVLVKGLEVIQGRYRLQPDKLHDQPVFKREATSESAPTFLYFWSEQGSEVVHGSWWIGSSPGGTSAWAFAHGHGFPPPLVGWRVAHASMPPLRGLRVRPAYETKANLAVPLSPPLRAANPVAVVDGPARPKWTGDELMGLLPGSWRCEETSQWHEVDTIGPGRLKCKSSTEGFTGPRTVIVTITGDRVTMGRGMATLNLENLSLNKLEWLSPDAKMVWLRLPRPPPPAPPEHG